MFRLQDVQMHSIQELTCWRNAAAVKLEIRNLKNFNLPWADADVGCSCPRRSAIPRNTISVGVPQPTGGDFADIIRQTMFSCNRRWAFQPIWNRLWQFCSIRSSVLPSMSTKRAARDRIISDVERGIPLQSRTHCRTIQMEAAATLTQIFIRTSGSNYNGLFTR